MAAWDRRTPWRQGQALKDETAITLGLVREGETSSVVAMVVSHDCDLAQSPAVEPSVEVVVGGRIPAPDGNFSHAKNPRRLHLPCSENGATIYLDLRAKEKRGIPKGELAEHLPNPNMSLTPKNRSVLQQWLAARYRRAAFPEEFERRLAETGLDKRIARILEPLGTYLIAIFFDVDEGQEIERSGADDVYKLRIDLLYSADHDSVAALDVAENAAGAISAAFRDRCFVPRKGWQGVELVACEPISDEAMTVSMAVQLKKWNADYLSFRADPPTEPMYSE